MRKELARASVGIRLLLVCLIVTTNLLAVLPAPLQAATPAAPTTALPPSLAAPATDDEPTNTPTTDLPPSIANKPEIVAARDLNRSAFDLGDGRTAVVQDTQPRNYTDATGEWQPIDPTFQAVAGGWINIHNTLQTSVAQSGSQAKISLSTVGVGWEPQALQLVDGVGEVLRTVAEPLPADSAQAGIRSTDSQTIRYPKSWSANGLEDTWQLAPGSAAYALRLAAQPTPDWRTPQSLELRVNLHLKPGTTVQIDGKAAALPLETDAVVSFVDAQGETLLLQPPTLYEEAQPSARQPGRYLLRMGSTPDTIDLRVRFDWSWLAATERTYPLILDPVFQTTSPFTAKVAHYSSFFNFVNNESTSVLSVGTFDSNVNRTLAHFEMPIMPPGTTIEEALLAAVPNGAVRLNELGYYRDRLQAFALANSDWITSDSAAPALANQLAPYVSNGYVHEVMSYNRGYRVHGGPAWVITDLARGWFQNPASNHGVLLKLTDECPPFFPFCSGFTMDYRSTFTREDLSGKDYNLYDAAGSGVKLIVVYKGPTLTVGQPIKSPPPSNDRRYYQADHVYHTAPAAARWQAVVTRGIEDGDGFDIIDNSPPLEVLPAGSTPQVEAAALTAAQAPIAPTIAGGNLLPAIETGVTYAMLIPRYELGYAMINGRQQPGAKYDARIRQVQGSTGPREYDIQLVDERPQQINAVLDQATELVTTFSNQEAMALWNITVPAGANNRVDVLFTGVTTGVGDYFHTRNFSGRLFLGNGGGLIRSDNQQVSFALEENGESAYGSRRLESETFPRKRGLSATNFGLALAYGDLPVPEDGTYDYQITIRVTSCHAGSFPTSGGGCQEVQCPIVNVNFTAEGFRRQGELGLWSFVPWTELGADSASTFFPATAPLIGGPSIGSSPTVAVVDGIVKYTGGDVRVLRAGNSNPTILLIDCQPGATEFSDWYEVTKHQMKNQVNGPQEAWLIADGPGGGLFVDPWPRDDRPDNDIIYVEPANARVGSTGSLRRYLNNSFTNEHEFAFAWSITVEGWSSLQSSATRTKVGSTPGVSSLSLDLGNSFTLDFDAVSAKFVAVRATAARITQPMQLGGASKALQVLIFPTNRPIPSPTPEACGYPNCIDLRSTRDRPTSPDRGWAMPDIHVTGEAGMVAVSANGALQVYSKDFPDELRQPSQAGGVLASAVNAPAAANDFNANFSYDTFGAKVVVRQGRCVEGDSTDVEIIEGATYVSLPSIGGSADTRIGSSFKLCQSSLRQVHMEFKTPVGVPLGNSGMFLTGLEGTVDIYPGHTTISFGIDIQAAPGGDGGILKMHGKVVIDTRGLFAFQGQGSVLSGVVGVDGALWVAWSPLDIGFRVNMGFPLKNPWIKGMLRAHMWQGQGFAHRYAYLPDNNESHIAAQASVTISIKQGAVFSWWFIDIPPFDIDFGIEVAFGQFCTNGACSQYEWGVKGKFTVVGYDIGLYYGFDAGFDFILGNDGHVLIDQYNGATDVPIMAAQATAADALDQTVTVYRSPNAIDAADDLIPFTVSPNAKQLLFGLGWQAGAPQLTLLPPGGGEITLANAASNGAQFQSSLQSTLVSVQHPVAGNWQARVSNLSDDGIEHYQFTYFANKGAPVADGENLFLTPSTPGEVGTDTYRITWRVPDAATEAATIGLYATRLADNRLGNTEAAVPIVLNLPLKQGFFDWNLSSYPFGDYAISGQVDDGINDGPAANSEDLCDVNFNPLPTQRAFDSQRFAITEVFTATGTIQPNDPAFPDAPTGLLLTPQDGALLARWNAANDPTVTAYQVHVQWSPFDWRDYTVLAGPTPSLRIGALQNEISYEVTVTAQDVEGKTSGALIGTVMPQSNVEPLPDVPITLTVGSVTGDSAELTWQPAAGSSPAGYRVHYTRVDRDGSTAAVDTATPSVTLTGLQAGAAYDVQVGALHSAGWESARSAAVRLVVTTGADGNNDGLPDDWAAAYGVSGGSNDPDGDGLTNGEERTQGTNPIIQDSDGDSFSDGEEVTAVTDPLDAISYSDLYSQPRLTLGQDRLVLHTKLQTPGEIAPTATISWTNTGGGNLSLAATSSAAWLSAQVVGNEIQIATNPAGLSAGQYTGVLRLAPAAGSDPLIGGNSPGGSCVQVQLWASPPDVDLFPNRLYLPIITRNGKASASGVSIFDDAVATGWEDWSWDSTVSLNATAPVHSGATAIAVTYNKAEAGFSLRAPAPINTAGYRAISFWAYGGGGGNTLLLYTQAEDVGQISSIQKSITIPAGRWTQVTVPLRELGNPAQIKRVNIQEKAGGAQATFYLDEMQLVP